MGCFAEAIFTFKQSRRPGELAFICCSNSEGFLNSPILKFRLEDFFIYGKYVKCPH